MTPILVPGFCFEAHCKFCDIEGEHTVAFTEYLVSTHEIKYTITCEHCYYTALLSKAGKYQFLNMKVPIQKWNNCTPSIYHFNFN